MIGESGVDVGKIEAEENFLVSLQFLFQEAMNERGLKLADVARLTGLSKARLSQLMRDDANPTLRTMVELFYALGIEIEPIRKDKIKASSIVDQQIRADRLDWKFVGEDFDKEGSSRADRCVFDVVAEQGYLSLEQHNGWYQASNDNPTHDDLHLEYATG